MIDLFQSRNTYNEQCKWWSRDERNQFESDELVMKRSATGSFCAKEVNAEHSQESIVAGAFMFEKTTITIKSPDDLSGIRPNDIVLFRDEKWIVVNTQRSKAKTQNTFFADTKNCSHYWFLELRK